MLKEEWCSIALDPTCGDLTTGSGAVASCVSIALKIIKNSNCTTPGHILSMHETLRWLPWPFWVMQVRFGSNFCYSKPEVAHGDSQSAVHKPLSVLAWSRYHIEKVNNAVRQRRSLHDYPYLLGTVLSIRTCQKGLFDYANCSSDSLCRAAKQQSCMRSSRNDPLRNCIGDILWHNDENSSSLTWSVGQVPCLSRLSTLQY